jgi:hypothetical protein
MTQVLKKKYHLNTCRETVRLALCQADPSGVAARKQHRLARRTYSSKGPNHAWHIDGYDKLRPYGFLISGYVTFLSFLLFLSIMGL